MVSISATAALTGPDLVGAYRILEGYVFGASIFDLGATPEHLSICRERYRDTGHPAFRAVATSDEAIGTHNDETFLHGLELLLIALGV